MATTATTQRRRPPKILFKFLNPLFTLILRSPLHSPLSKRLLLLTFTGRRSGKQYTTPVGYAQVDDTLLLGTQSGWLKNLHAGARVHIRLQGRQRTGVSEVITDEVGISECYRTMLTLAAGYGRAIGVSLGPDGQPNQVEVARARQEGHVVVRIKLDP